MPQTPRDGKSFSVLFSSSPGSGTDNLPGYKGSESYADDGLDVDNVSKSSNNLCCMNYIVHRLRNIFPNNLNYTLIVLKSTVTFIPI